MSAEKARRARDTLASLDFLIVQVNEHTRDRGLHEIRVGAVFDCLDIVAGLPNMDMPDPRGGLIEFTVACAHARQRIVKAGGR